ncbi:hypothetical protein [Bacteroides caecigallinarum]|uniref:hypothetical protein n=1 Tax=Bacteroides caecigallinarum TaxID=1411144 RepID=UPI00195A61A6|nr:hypothetical protein [Bacteroides caecigallinarum]MBM6882856.1 hypothetical protein [Bacteroides caecigallinarum]
MKKTKFAVFFTALMVMLGLSSCLGEPDPYNTVTEVMKVNNFMGLYSFSSIYGYTVEPNDQSLFTTSINNEFARVTYKYDTRTLNLNSENNKIDADILYLAPIDEIKYAYETIEANTGMYKVSSSASFFDKVNMFLDLTYYYEYSSDKDDLKEELAKHSFYLSKANAEDDEDVKDGTVVLYLNHVVADPENNDDRKNYGTETRHFNLNYVLAGSEPDEIIIKFKQNTYSAAVDDKNAKDSDITIDYKSIVEYFNKNSNN